MSCANRDNCRDKILNATVSIAHIVKHAMVAHGAGRQDRVIPLLRELDHYLMKIERAVNECKSE